MMEIKALSGKPILFQGHLAGNDKGRIYLQAFEAISCLSARVGWLLGIVMGSGSKIRQKHFLEQMKWASEKGLMGGLPGLACLLLRPHCEGVSPSPNPL